MTQGKPLKPGLKIIHINNRRRVIPIGCLKLANIPKLIRRMRLQYAMNPTSYPRKTYPRRSPEELRKHLELSLPWAKVDFFEIWLHSAKVTAHAHHMPVPFSERNLKGTISKAIKGAIYSQGREHHVLYKPNDPAKAPFFFHDGRDRDLVITSGPSDLIGLKIEVKGRRRDVEKLLWYKEKYGRGPDAVLHLPLKTLEQLLENPRARARTTLRIWDDRTFMRKENEIRIRVVPLHIPYKDPFEELLSRFDDIIKNVEILHRVHHGRYSRKIFYDGPFDPKLRGVLYV